jgi:hypothetical protein
LASARDDHSPAKRGFDSLIKMKALFKQDAPAWPIPLVFAGLVAAFDWKVLWGGALFGFIDSSRFFYPFWKWGSRVLHQGMIPLWNPDAQFGSPYLADPQMAIAYPPIFLLYSFLKPTDAFTGLILLHHFWALLGFWALARHERFSVAASFLGSLAFGFSLHVVCSSWTPVALLTISWVPWIFWAAQRLWEDYAGAVLGLSFFWAMQVAAGYPVLSYLTGFALAAHFLWKSFWPWPKRFSWLKLKWVPAFCFSGGVAAAYNLVWLLPFLEFKKLSNYAQGAIHAHPLQMADFATWIAPFFQGMPLSSDYQGPEYWIATYFMGLPVVALLAWGFWKGVFLRTSWVLFGLFLLLSLGETLFLGSFLKGWLPGYSLVIRSGFWLPIVILFAARLAMEASDNFFRKEFRKSHILWAWMIAWVLTYGASFVLKRPLNLWGFGLSLALGILAAIPAWFTPRWRWAFLILSLLVSLGQAATRVNVLLEGSYYDAPPRALSVMEKPGRLFESPSVLEQAGILKGDSIAAAYEGAKQSLYPDWPLAFGREEAEIYNSLYLAAPDNWIWTSLRFSKAHSRRVMDYLEVRYLLGPNLFADFKPLGNTGSPLEISENPEPLPKWFSVQRALAASELKADFQRASAVDWDYGKTCFVQNKDRAGVYQVRQITEIARSPQRIELEAEGQGPALLVSSETAYPGWRAYVEGQARSLETVNHVFRGLYLGATESQVRISYEPATFRLGLFGCLLICAFWAALGVARWGGERQA